MSAIKSLPLQIDGVLEKVREKKIKDRIWQIGIEVEGGWLKLPEGTNVIRDGSIRLESPPPPEDSIPLSTIVIPTVSINGTPFSESDLNYMQQQRRAQLLQASRPKLHVGEIPSHPMDTHKFPIWMKKNYPSHVNGTCGLHVHMSFKSMRYYQALMIPEYQKTIIAYITKWGLKEGFAKDHPLWARLGGKNEYCKDEFHADTQSRKTSKAYDHHGEGNRYTMINYCHGLHTTLECRLLPMFDKPEEGIKAVQEILDITNACVVKLTKKEERISSSLIVDGSLDIVREASRIVIPPHRISATLR